MATTGWHLWKVFDRRASFAGGARRLRGLGHSRNWWARRGTFGSLLAVSGAIALVWFIPQLFDVLLWAAIAAVVALFVHQLADPSPLFWTAPDEAWELQWSRVARVNHAWLHRTQELLRNSPVPSTVRDGTATADGFLLVMNDLRDEEVRWFAELSWRTMLQEFPSAEAVKGCKSVRFLLTQWFATGGLLALAVFGPIDLPRALLCMVVCTAVSHVLGRRFESLLLSFAELAARKEEKAGLCRVEVEQVEIPKFLWLGGGHGFWVRRVSSGVAQEIKENERAVQALATGR